MKKVGCLALIVLVNVRRAWPADKARGAQRIVSPQERARLGYGRSR
jgi:hypothetical protein